MEEDDVTAVHRSAGTVRERRNALVCPDCCHRSAPFADAERREHVNEVVRCDPSCLRGPFFFGCEYGGRSGMRRGECAKLELLARPCGLRLQLRQRFSAGESQQGGDTPQALVLPPSRWSTPPPHPYRSVPRPSYPPYGHSSRQQPRSGPNSPKPVRPHSRPPLLYRSARPSRPSSCSAAISKPRVSTRMARERWMSSEAGRGG